MTKYITAVKSGFRMAAASAEEQQASLAATEPAQLYPNPTTTPGFTLFSSEQPAELPVMHDSHGQLIDLKQVKQQQDKAGWHTTYRLVNQQAKSGLYVVETVIDGKRVVRQLSIQLD